MSQPKCCRGVLLSIGLMILAGTVGVGALFAGQAKGNPEAGKKIYLESCQSCHGPTGKDDSDMATRDSGGQSPVGRATVPLSLFGTWGRCLKD